MVSNYGMPVPVRPFWSIEETPESFFEWVKELFGEVSNEQNKVYRKDVFKEFFYEGFQEARSNYGTFALSRDVYERDSITKVSVNRTEEVVEQWVNRIARASRKLNVNPADSQEHSDRIAAKIAEEFLEYIWYQHDIDTLREDVARASFVTGDDFVVVEYDRGIGDVVDGAQSQAQAGYGSKEQLIKPDGANTPVTLDGDTPIFYEKVQRTGDVRVRRIKRRNLILQPGKKTFDESDFCIEIDIEDVAKLLVSYPDISPEQILGTSSDIPGISIGDIFAGDTDEKGPHQVYVYKLYHKGTEFLDPGRYIVFTTNAILEASTAVDAFGHRDMPIVPFSCFPSMNYPRSRGLVDKLIMLQVLRNNIFSIMYTNMVLGAQIKWLIDRASRVERSDVNNLAGIILYSGNKPELVQFRTIGQELFAMIDTIDKAIDRIAAIHEISRGEVPARADSGAMVAQLEEIEAKRSHSIMQKHDRGLERIGRLALAVAGAFYKPEESRTIRIVGKGNAFSVRKLDVTKLGGPYDIRIERGSGLSDSKTGRISQIKEIMQAIPAGTLPPEQIIDLIDLGNDQRYYDLSRVAIEAAESENEVLVEDGVVAAPMLYEELHLHWYSHLKFMQSPSFKETLPEKIRLKFIEHVKATEVLMVLRSITSPTYGQMLASTPAYASFPALVQKQEVEMLLASQQSVQIPMGQQIQSSPQEEMQEPVDNQQEEGGEIQ